jgi:hypothetical protein
VVVQPASSATTFPDVPTTHWAYAAVQYVTSHSFITPYSNGFHPDQLATRLELARALTGAFAPSEPVDPTITFTDLPSTTPGYAYRVANIAVKKGWLSKVSGAFNPSGQVSKSVMDRALVVALGLNSVVDGLNRIKTVDGYGFARTSWFGFFIIANELHLNFDYPSSLERQEVLAPSPISRAFLAYGVWQSKTLSQWQLSSIQSYGTIVLPQMNDIEKQVVTFALRYAGYPYVYAGEWYKPTGTGYCCGTQLQGGFDCSGFAWWVLKAPAGTWNNVSIRGYNGWFLPERGAAAMTGDAPVRISYANLQPGDLLGFNTDGVGTGWQGVDHAGIYLGNGWMVHSSGSRGGVSIDYIGSGSWWYSRLVWGRRLLPTYTPPPPPPPPPSPSPSPSPSTSPSPSVTATATP